METRDDVLIQVRNLKKYYNKGAIKALDDISIDINKGDVMVVIGPSGSGKSTFLRSLNLLEIPTAGSIIFDGVDRGKWSGWTWTPTARRWAWCSSISICSRI